MIWDDIIPEQDKEIFARGGYGRKYELGRKPALLLIDFTYEFTGWAPVPVLQAQNDFHTACGENAWQAAGFTRRLLEAARRKGLPIVYTRVDRDYKANPYDQKKNLDTGRKPLSNNDRATQIIDELRPGEGELVVSKIAPSAFWGTPLVSYLIKNQIDTLIVAGGVTSGCVRASVNDAFSLGYKICLVEDCVFDRGEASHKVNLWDMNAKQANVVGLAEALKYIGQF